LIYHVNGGKIDGTLPIQLQQKEEESEEYKNELK